MSSEAKRIAFFAPGIYPDVTGGMEIFNYFLVKELSQKYVITLYTKSRSFHHPNVKVVRISGRLFGISGFGCGQILLCVHFLLRLLFSNEKYDLVHLPFTSNAKYWGLFFPLLPKLFHIPYAVVIHGGGLREWKPKFSYAWLFRYASEIAGVSEVIQDEYQKRTGRHIGLILPLIPFAQSGFERQILRGKYSVGEQDIVLLYLGSLKELKRPEDILSALNILGSDFLQSNHVRMFFVGDGVQREELQVLTKEMNLADFVSFVGQVPYEETAKYYEIADVYIISSRFEGTSKSMVGALRFGLPVIGSDVPGLNNVLANNQNALLYPLGDTEALARQIAVLVINDELRRALGEKARLLYDAKYSFDQTIKDVAEMYDRIRL